MSSFFDAIVVIVAVASFDSENEEWFSRSFCATATTTTMPFKTDYRKKRQQRIDLIGRFIMFSNEYRIYAKEDDIISADGIHVESFFRRSSIKK